MSMQRTFNSWVASAALFIAACAPVDPGTETPAEDGATPLPALISELESGLTQLRELTATHHDALEGADELTELLPGEAMHQLEAEALATTITEVVEAIAECDHHGDNADAAAAMQNMMSLQSELERHGGAMPGVDDMAGASTEEARHQEEMTSYFDELGRFVGMFDAHGDHFSCDAEGGDDHAEGGDDHAEGGDDHAEDSPTESPHSS